MDVSRGSPGAVLGDVLRPVERLKQLIKELFMSDTQTKFQQGQRVIIADTGDPDYNHEARVVGINVAPNGMVLYELEVSPGGPNYPNRFLRDEHLRAA